MRHCGRFFAASGVHRATNPSCRATEPAHIRANIQSPVFGLMAEMADATDLKSVWDYPSVGSSPTKTTVN